jgi:YVTN family beta-propeller protein
VEFRILGPFEVVEEGQPLVLAVGKQRALLAILLLHANEVVSRDRLIEELWGEQAPASAAKSIQIYISQLRKRLDRRGERLVTRPNGYELLVARNEVDANRFEDHVDAARRAEPEEAAAKFRAALALWRGPPLADFHYEPFAQAEIARLEERRLSVLEQRIEADLVLGRHADLVGELEALVAAHPLRERLRGLLMLALYRSGRQAEALKVYQQTRDALVDELGLEPSRELHELEQAILRQDPSLDLSPTAGAPIGTVTMVFTDIEGSTMLVRQLGERYEQVLNTHCLLLRDAFREAGGVEVDRQGDAFFFVVPRAKDALLAAAAAQRAFAQEIWPAGTQVRVRIGVHTGEPGLGEEGYHGLGVVRAARISAAGHGGQVLLSQATRALIEDEELEDLDVRDLGEHQLKDMPQPERIFQLVGPGLADDFPPVRAPAGARPLPVAGTEEELAEAAREAAAGSVVAPPRTLVERISRHPVALIAGGAIVVAAAIASAFLFTGGAGSGGLDHVAPNSVGAIDLESNKIVAQVPVGTRPGPIVYGHGQLWVANLDNETVSKVDAKTRAQTDVISLSAHPNALAVQERGIWAATDLGVKSIDPAFDDVRTINVEKAKLPTALFSSAPTAIAFTPGYAWFVIGSHLTRANGATGRRLEAIPVGNYPTALAAGAADLWVTDNFDNAVSRIDEGGAITATTTVGRAPNSLAVGSDAVWVADADDDDVKRIDPDTASVVTTIHVGHHPSAVALSPGAVWVANQYDGTVWRIDAHSNKVVTKIKVGGSPAGLAVAAGSMWVSVQASPLVAKGSLAKGGVARIDLNAGAIDPAEQNAFTLDAAQWEYATCARLLNYPDKPAPAGSQLQPELAQSMPKISRNGRTYTFKIRRGYRFSPGSNQPVTAQAVKYTIERSLSPQPEFPAYNYVRDIFGEAAYRKGKAGHISGVTARGNTLTIKLTHAAGDLAARLSMPFFCVVPTNTPLRRTEKPIPFAGPYYVASHRGTQMILKRNPNYKGPRPHRLRGIVYAGGGLSTQRSIARIGAGQADYVTIGGTRSGVRVDRLNVRYGLNSPAARRGHQQLFINPAMEVDGLLLNTSRPLFAKARLRRAVSYAMNRRALARYGGIFFTTGPLTATTADQYLPPGVRGFRDASIYPIEPDLAKARHLAGGIRRKAVLYTCNFSPCPQWAQVVKGNLAAIGVSVEIRPFKLEDLFAKQSKRGEPWDIGLMTWAVDYPDPFDVLNYMFDGNLIDQPQAGNLERFDNTAYNRRLHAAARLSGPKRYHEYARLDADIARDAAPIAAFANETRIDFFSARMGCQLYHPIYGMDLAALCIKAVSHTP